MNRNPNCNLNPLFVLLDVGVWALFTSVVQLPDLSLLSEVGQMVKQILNMLGPLVDAAKRAAEGLAGMAGGLIDNAPGPAGDLLRMGKGLF